MKLLKVYRISLIFTLIFLVLTNLVSAHAERVHQYLAREGYKLLKLYLGNRDIPIMLNHLGYKETGNYFNWYSRGDDNFSEGKIVTGAFREDVRDIVWGYGQSIVPGIDEAMQYALASVTHFWEADQGDNALTNLSGVPYSNMPNAYQKMLVYKSDMWISIMGSVEATTPNNEPVRLINLDGQRTSFYYNNLINFFKTGLMFVPIIIARNTITGVEKTYQNSNFYINKDLRERIAFEILGRMSHLIADMSVPAHVHNNEHRYADQERYEKILMDIKTDDESFSNQYVTYWDANRVWSTFGNIMNPYVSYDTPLHMLMYTTNQLADPFSSYTVAGDDTFISTFSEVQQYFPYGIQPTTIDGYKSTPTQNLTTIRDATFPHAIRAIAGLFYWFAKEADILPKPLTYVYLSGTYSLYQGGTGNWYVQLGNGLEPFTYQWEIMYLDGAGYLQNYESVKKEKEKREKDKDKKKDGDIIITAAPSNSWFPVGTNSSVFSQQHNPYVIENVPNTKTKEEIEKSFYAGFPG